MGTITQMLEECLFDTPPGNTPFTSIDNTVRSKLLTSSSLSKPHERVCGTGYPYEQDGEFILEYPFDYQQSQYDQTNHQCSRISKGSVRVLQRSLHSDFQTRMRHYINKSQQKKDHIQNEIDEKYRKEQRPTPSINVRSKNIHRNLGHLFAWNNDKEENLTYMRSAARQREGYACVGVPKISCQSEKLFTSRVDDIAKCKVEDRLQLIGLIYEYQQEERMIQHARNAAPCQPQLAPHSTKLRRPTKEPVHNRLFDLAHKQLKSQTTEDHPSSKKNVKTLEEVNTSVDRLLRQGEIYRNKRQAMQHKQNSYQATTKQPHQLKARTARMATKARQRSEVKKHTPVQENNIQVRRIDAGELVQMYNRQLRWLEARKEKYNAIKLKYDVMEQQECTFRNPLFNGELKEHASVPSTSFFDKNMQWVEKKNRHIDDERRLRDKMTLRDCTFQPCVLRKPSVLRSSRTDSEISPAMPGYFSETLQTIPFLDVDSSEIESDDLIEDQNELSDNSLSIIDELIPKQEMNVLFFDQGAQVLYSD